MSSSTQQDTLIPSNNHEPSDTSPNPTPSESKQPLPLPEPSSEESTKIDVNGEGVKLDHLGPLVVNKDGTLSRITNWANMAEIERQNTLRILGKRNQLRTESLKTQESK
ncbi:Nn.00g023700.m01.CDS01 [Neocucurbitaria sp. VM-36]